MDEEELFLVVQLHHINCPMGEGTEFKCPHCGKRIMIELKSLEMDEDTINIWYGKDEGEIKRKQKVEEESLF